MIVQMLRSTASTEWKAFCSAMPVTMPGNAMGRITRKLTVERPKNR